MAQPVDAEQLLNEVAARAKIGPQVLKQLLDLEAEFPDFTIYGSKTNFARQVAVILDAASAEEQQA